MDFWKRSLEAAQTQAKLAAANAGRLAEHISHQTSGLAEQASSLSRQAAEQAHQRLQGLHVVEHLDALAASRHQQEEPAPSPAELRAYAITPEFQEFVCSLTYSTFRDFPMEELEPAPQQTQQQPPPSKGPSHQQQQEEGLTPWQEHHAMLVVRVVKEVNQLRFVLCPKRMTDNHFWRVYFTLSRNYLPDAAFDPSCQLPEVTAHKQEAAGALDLQSRLQQLAAAARTQGQQSTAWLRSTAGGAVGYAKQDDRQPAGQPSGKFGPKDQQSGSPGASPSHMAEVGPDDSIPAGSVPGNGRQEASSAHKDSHRKLAESKAGRSDDEDDFNKYLSETLHQSGSHADKEEDDQSSAAGSGLDLDQYMAELEAEDGKDA